MRNKTLYLECFSGISGDMAVASLIDLGVEHDHLLKALDSLHLDGYKVKISRVNKSGIDACDFDVILDDAHANHDHDMEYLHGNPRHEHSHEHEHHHEHGPVSYTHLDVYKRQLYHYPRPGKRITARRFHIDARCV